MSLDAATIKMCLQKKRITLICKTSGNADNLL